MKMGAKMETYQEFKNRQSDEFGKFEGIFFAFSNEQLAEGMEKIGLPKDDFKSIVSIGAGGYLRRDRVQAFKDFLAKQKAEKNEFKKDKKALIEALAYELSNHEYCITYDPADALERLGYTVDTIPAGVLKKAIEMHNETVVY
jgi:hypothetical protein